MMFALQVINSFFLVLVILCVVDACRVTRAADNLWLTAVRMCLAVGATGSLLGYRPSTLPDMLFAVVQNAGLAILCVAYLRRELKKAKLLLLPKGWRHVQHP